MKSYYYVYRVNNQGPKIKHATLKEAYKEAMRIAAQHPSDSFEILQCLGTVRTTRPQIFWMEDTCSRLELGKSEVWAGSGSLNPLLDILHEIQDCVENMPCGGIGKNGPSQVELDDASKEGRPVEEDATYHQGQQSWLIAQRGLDMLSNSRRQL